MGFIRSAASNLSAVAYVEQAGDPTTVALRWLSYFKSDGMYQKSPAGAALRMLTSADLTNPTITNPTIAKIANLTTNGYVKTSGGDGTLSVVTGITVPTLIGSGNTAALAAGVTRYNCLFSVSQITSETNARSRLFWAGTLRNLSVRTTGVNGAGGSLVATIYINGSPTTITTTVAAGAGAGEFVDTTHTAAVVAGDYIDIQFVNNDGANPSTAIGNWTLEYDVVV